MPKNVSIIKLSGKVGDQVHVDSEDGNHLRSASKKGRKRKEPFFKEQMERTPFINLVAGQVNTAFNQFDPQFMPRRYYKYLHKLIRLEPLNNRLLLLHQLKGIEVNAKYPLTRFNAVPEISLKTKRNEVLIELKALKHPRLAHKQGNCYYYEALFLLWNNSYDPCLSQSMMTTWIYPEKEEVPLIFDINFSKSNDSTDYIVCILESIGQDGRAYDTNYKKGMIVVEVNSFEEEGQALLEKKKMDSAAKLLLDKENSKRSLLEEKRVGPRKA